MLSLYISDQVGAFFLSRIVGNLSLFQLDRISIAKKIVLLETSYLGGSKMRSPEIQKTGTIKECSPPLPSLFCVGSALDVCI